jgi:hypothetical protein
MVAVAVGVGLAVWKSIAVPVFDQSSRVGIAVGVSVGGAVAVGNT